HDHKHNRLNDLAQTVLGLGVRCPGGGLRRFGSARGQLRPRHRVVRGFGVRRRSHSDVLGRSSAVVFRHESPLTLTPLAVSVRGLCSSYPSLSSGGYFTPTDQSPTQPERPPGGFRPGPPASSVSCRLPVLPRACA